MNFARRLSSTDQETGTLAARTSLENHVRALVIQRFWRGNKSWTRSETSHILLATNIGPGGPCELPQSQ